MYYSHPSGLISPSAFSLVDKIAAVPFQKQTYALLRTIEGFDSGSSVGCIIHGGVWT